MKLTELMDSYERRRADADRHHASAPIAVVYALVLEELRALDAGAIPDRMMGTAEAAQLLSLAPKTVAKWAAEGRFAGALKTSEAGEWRLPARSVYERAGVRNARGVPSIPRLWKSTSE